MLHIWSKLAVLAIVELGIVVVNGQENKNYLVKITFSNPL